MRKSMVSVCISAVVYFFLTSIVLYVSWKKIKDVPIKYKLTDKHYTESFPHKLRVELIFLSILVLKIMTICILLASGYIKDHT